MTHDRASLAEQLAILDGVEHQFAVLVKQIIEGQREVASARIMSKAGTTPDAVARDLNTLDRALEKMEGNLRSQFPLFFEAHVRFRAERLSSAELEESVEALKNERVQEYLTRIRALQDESSFVFRQFVEKMVRRVIRNSMPPPPVARRS